MTNDQINNPLGLSQQELPMYRLFKERHNREPECMWELMCWSAGQSRSNTLCEQLLGFAL